MAGSDHSGEDMEAGRTNRAEDRTQIWAQRTDSDDGDDFNGAAIFVVDVAPSVDDSSDFLDDDWMPQHPLDGIVASGWSGKVTLSGNIGGVGVVGNGGGNQGTGVLGRGGGGTNGGVGGIGVHGIGGSQSEPTWDATDPPGTGVVGQGGRQATNDLRLPHGAGVIGFAGGKGKPLPPLTDTGSVGVYAQGAEAEVSTINLNGVDTTVGPTAPGPGVLGRGGVPIPPRGPVAAGVIGLAGDAPIPPLSETGDNGVYGAGPTGVFGHGAEGVRGKGDSMAGVHGLSDKDRGGVFEAGRSAQVQLVPGVLGGSLPAPVPVTATAIPAQREGPSLPKDGRGGDLMAVMDARRECTLWFCVRSGDGGPAQWAQVLLGQPFEGRA